MIPIILLISAIIIFVPGVWQFVRPIVLGYLALVALTCAHRALTISWGRRHKRPVSPKEAVLITGATSGIGLATAKHLFKLGYSIVAAYYDSSEPGYAELENLAKKCKQEEQKIIFQELDVRSIASVRSAHTECVAALRENNLSLYALINNAGRGSLQPFAWLQRETMRGLVETNIMGTLFMTREFLPELVLTSGRIVNVSSGLGLVPGPTYTTYGVTKCAQLYLTRALNMELGQLMVTAVSVIPHNFLKNTNICSQNVKTNEEAWEELSALERNLYKDFYVDHLKLVKSLELATRKLNASSGSSDHDGKQENKSKNKKARENQPHRGALDWLWAGFGAVRAILERLQGENVALTLEDSGILECFEDALRLNNPPEHIFAGDNIYNLLIGSILLSMPTSCTGLLGYLVEPSLYK